MPPHSLKEKIIPSLEREGIKNVKDETDKEGALYIFKT
jgi:hypothetical protein